MKTPDLVITMEGGLITSVTALNDPAHAQLKIAIVDYDVRDLDDEDVTGLLEVPQAFGEAKTQRAACWLHNVDYLASEDAIPGYLDTLRAALGLEG
jgi:hypothetical protein